MCDFQEKETLPLTENLFQVAQSFLDEEDSSETAQLISRGVALCYIQGVCQSVISMTHTHDLFLAGEICGGTGGAPSF